MNAKGRKIAVVAACLLLIAAVCLGIYLIFRQIEQSTYAASEDRGHLGLSTVPEIEISDKKYAYNADIKTVVFLGIDQSGPLEEKAVYQEAGQSDVILLLSFDLKKKTYFILPVNRDTVTDVTVYGPFGAEQATQPLQITLAYGYGNGGRSSGENTLKALGALLNQIPFYGYIAAPVDTVALVNDAVGGVTIRPEKDFSNGGLTVKAGEEITLTGTQATLFVRGRKNVDDETNASRMARQKLFYSALMKKCKTLSATALSGIYDKASSYTKSSMSRSEAAKYLALTTEYEFKGIYQIPGTTDTSGANAAFYPEEKGLQKLLAQLYYTEQT